MGLFLCYKKCSTCKKASDYLDQKSISYDSRDIKEDRPSYDELKLWVEKSGLDIKKFFNTSGMVYRERKLKDKLPTMTLEEKLELLAEDGMLVKRPIYVDEGRVLVGFKEKDWDQAFQEDLD